MQNVDGSYNESLLKTMQSQGLYFEVGSPNKIRQTIVKHKFIHFNSQSPFSNRPSPRQHVVKPKTLEIAASSLLT